MKWISAIIIALGLFAFSCDGLEIFDKDHNIPVEQLPPSILQYIQENYPNSTIKDAERETDGDKIRIEVELDTGEELIFDESGTFIELSDETD